VLSKRVKWLRREMRFQVKIWVLSREMLGWLNREMVSVSHLLATAALCVLVHGHLYKIRKRATYQTSLRKIPNNGSFKKV
jgi:hypothetical protein